MKLIDAEQLSKHKYVVGCDGAVDMGYISAVNILAYKLGWNDALASVIDYAPTVDAVKVVRCGECKYYRNGGCLTGRYDLKDTDFCSLGERKND